MVDKLLTHAGYAAAADTDAAARFGHMVADMQVRAPVRVLCRQLRVAGVPATRVLRYRVAFRPAFFADMYPADAGVTHGADMFVWWGTRRLGFSDEEWAKVQAWLGVTLARLVRGEGFATGATDDVESYLLLGPKGEMSPVKDQYWRHLMSVMEAVSWVEERGGP